MEKEKEREKMKYIEQTYEVIFLKHIEAPVDEKWKDWAYQMILNDFETEHLLELASIQKPYNQFELSELTTKVFEELELDTKNREVIAHNFIRFILREILIQESVNIWERFKVLFDISYDFDEFEILEDIRNLVWAKQDLDYDPSYPYQHYWEGATIENIDELARSHINKWLKENRYID